MIMPDASTQIVLITPAVEDSTAHMKQICYLCFAMYGAVGCLWAGYYSRGRAASRADGSYVTLLCISWASTSIGMQVVNKSVVSALDAPALVSAVQMVIAVVAIGCASWREFLHVETRQLGYWLIVPFFFAAMLCTSCYTYQYISLSLMVVVRNLMPLIVLPIERSVMPVEKQPILNRSIVISLLTMLAGTLLFVGGIDTVSLIGLAFACSNMCMAACDRLLQRRLLTEECKDLPSSVCTVMNNALGLGPTLALALITHQVADMQKPQNAIAWKDWHVLFLLMLSGIIGIGICFLGFECQRVISATSFFVLQNVSKIVVIVCGVVIFQDSITSYTAFAGMLLSLLGSFAYGRAQMQQHSAALKPTLNDAEGGSATETSPLIDSDKDDISQANETK